MTEIYNNNNNVDGRKTQQKRRHQQQDNNKDNDDDVAAWTTTNETTMNSSSMRSCSSCISSTGSQQEADEEQQQQQQHEIKQQEQEQQQQEENNVNVVNNIKSLDECWYEMSKLLLLLSSGSDDNDRDMDMFDWEKDLLVQIERLLPSFFGCRQAVAKTTKTKGTSSRTAAKISLLSPNLNNLMEEEEEQEGLSEKIVKQHFDFNSASGNEKEGLSSEEKFDLKYSVDIPYYCRSSNNKRSNDQDAEEASKESVNSKSTTKNEVLGRIHIFEYGQKDNEGNSIHHPEDDHEDDGGNTTTSNKMDQQKDDDNNISRLRLVAELLGRAWSEKYRRQGREFSYKEFYEQSAHPHCVIDVVDHEDQDDNNAVSSSFHHVNPAWTSVFGWSLEETIGKNPCEFLHPEDIMNGNGNDDGADDKMQYWFSSSSHLTEDDEDGGGEKEIQSPMSRHHHRDSRKRRFRTKDGSFRWLSWSSSFVPGSNNKRRKRMLVIGHDVTAEMEERNALQKEVRILEESQKIAGIGQWELDLTSNALFWTDGIYRLFRVDKERFGASYEAFLNAIHPDDRDYVNNAYTTSVQTKEPYNIAHRLLYDDGTIRYVNEICRTEYSETGVPLRSIGTVQDITDLTKLQEDLRIAKEKAEEADRSTRLKSAFLANMSHEIRTPMNAIIGYTDLLLMDAESLSKMQHEYLKIIKSSGKMLLTLISDILDISKIEAGQMTVERKPFSLQDTFRAVHSSATGLLSRKGCGGQIELKGPVDFSLDGFCNFVVGDQKRIQQILNNLLSNAIKFTESGTVKYDVKLLEGDSSSSSGTKMLEFRVSDTGIGISASDQQLIFEPFRQARAGNDRHELGGTGLGLSIGRKLVQIMGGKVRLESSTDDNDHGSTFYFTVPYIPARKEDGVLPITKAPTTTQQQRAVSAGGKVNGKILIVDDIRVNLKLVERVIVRMGCSCITAMNGEEAVDIFTRDRSIDLILMDKEMPVCDGLIATRRIRDIESIEHRKKMPIIALTAAAMTGDREELLAAGCSDYIAKPLDRQKLSGLLASYLSTTQ